MPGLIPRPVVTAIAAVVIAVWALSQVAEIFVPTYDAPAELHLAVMAVLGALFAVGKPAKAALDVPAPDDAPALPPGRVSAADLIARLDAERRGGGAG